MAKIELRKVNVLYEDKGRNFITAIDDVSFSFHENAINVLMGASGSGKSTLLKCLTGELIYEGHILYDGKELEPIKPKDRKISYMTQDLTIYPHMNVYENIMFPLKLSKMDYDLADQKIKEIAIELDIDYLLTRKPKYISLGQASRVALAKALVKDSTLYLFDEPTKGLDLENKNKVMSLIKNHMKKYGKTAIYVTHESQDAIYLADYIYVIDKGKFIGVFTPQEYLESDNEIIKQLRSDLDETKKD